MTADSFRPVKFVNDVFGDGVSEGRRMAEYALEKKEKGFDPLEAALVFLKLLERDAERFGNHLLGQACFLPPQEQARCDMAINRVGKTVRHNLRRLDEKKPRLPSRPGCSCMSHPEWLRTEYITWLLNPTAGQQRWPPCALFC